MTSPGRQDRYLSMVPRVVLKKLELPHIYNITTDELYEINDEAYDFLLQCDGSQTAAELKPEADFLTYCLEEELIREHDSPGEYPVSAHTAPEPSLRYLELQLTHRCNLRCKHCYLGSTKNCELSLEHAVKISREFETMGGLRLLISGGEPLLYPALKEFLDEIKDLSIRTLLITNGTLITENIIKHLNIDEIQFSMDGWQHGHDFIRGTGSFEKLMQGIRISRDAGKSISFATMIHKENMNEFDSMNSFVEDMEAESWGIDVPCRTGNLQLNRDLLISNDDAALKMQYGFGGGSHNSSLDFACGLHLFSVLPTGSGVKCGFYSNEPLGDVRQSLLDSWLKLEHIPLKQLTCSECTFISECHGGCRYRAEKPLGPDPVMCALYGIAPPV